MGPTRGWADLIFAPGVFVGMSFEVLVYTGTYSFTPGQTTPARGIFASEGRRCLSLGGQAEAQTCPRGAHRPRSVRAMGIAKRGRWASIYWGPKFGRLSRMEDFSHDIYSRILKCRVEKTHLPAM
jgi:hypothetical protein